MRTFSLVFSGFDVPAVFLNQYFIEKYCKYCSHIDSLECNRIY